MRTKIVFHVDAGRFESDGEKNYKYCDQAETLEGAIQMYEMALGYEFVEFYLVVTLPNGLKRTVYLDGGPTDENRACLGQLVIRQRDTIRALEGELAARDARISALKFELGMGSAQKLVWQDIHARFEAGQLTWTESFDALMSQCGMPMEEALQCLAENFDRRPAVNVKEV